jgi:polyhydroxybutyrate depolymerase
VPVPPEVPPHRRTRARKTRTRFVAQRASLVLALALAGATATSAASAQAGPPAPGTYEVDLDHQGHRRFFLLHVPPQAADGRPLPLVLNFHGGGGEPRAHEAWSGMDALADRAGFIVVYPAGYSRRGAPGRSFLTWNAGNCCGPALDDASDDVGFVRQVLIETNARVAVDATRVYATGMSNGAMMSYRVARELSDRIAAIAPVSGASDVPPPPGAQPVPVLHFHSVDDPRAPYAGGEGPPFPFTERRVRHPSVEAVISLWAAHNGCAATPTTGETRTSPRGHKATRIAYATCTSGMPVVLWRLQGSGHVWPGAPQKYAVALLGAATDVLDANDEIWSFFRSFRRPQAPPLPAPATPAPPPSPIDAAGGPGGPGARAPRDLELPFSSSSLALRAVGARDRFTDGGGASSTRSALLSLRARTTLFGRFRLDRDGPRASGFLVGIDGRAFTTDLPAVSAGDRFYRLGVSLGGFYLTPQRNLFWIQAGLFVAEQSQLLDDPRWHVYGVGLGTARVAATARLVYGLGYTFDFGRGLPLPFLGVDWRCAPAWRLDVLLPVLARLTWRATTAWSLTLGTTVAGDIFRYRASDALGTGQEIRDLRIARLRAGGGARYAFTPGVRGELELGVEGASIDDGLGARRAGGGYLTAALVLGRGGDGPDGVF